jgi:diguanylate cyclase (GGDEF)-like protein/PAS domain S-box-containing protein
VERWLASTLESMGDAVVATDAEGRVTFVNPVAEALTGWDAASALGRRLDEVLRLVDPETREPIPDLVRRVVGKEMVIEIGDCQLLARDGWERPVDDSAAPIRDAAGDVVGVVVVFRDVGARKQVEEKLHHAATHDPLTGLPNRALMLDRLTRIFEYSKRHPEHGFGVLPLDLDRFKAINDGLGHLSGDQVLTPVARRLDGELRAPDTVARFGGDEFVVLLDGIPNAREALLVAERVQKSLEAPIDVGAKRSPPLPASAWR